MKRIARHTACLVCAVLALGPSGCGLGDGGDDGGRNVRLQGTSVEIRPDGSLTADPPPVTLRDLARQGSDSPEGTIFRLWFFAQWGAVPSVARLYDPRVRATGVLPQVSGGYASQRSLFLSSRPRVIFRRRDEAGTHVGVELLRHAAVPVRESYVLRRRGSRWTVVYDTVAEQLIRTYAESFEKAGPNDKPTRSTVRAGQLAAQRFRSVSLRGAARAGTRPRPGGSAPR
jgi:hypothetical protein